MTLSLAGHRSNGNVVIGKACIIRQSMLEGVPKQLIAPNLLEAEINRFQLAVQQTQEELQLSQRHLTGAHDVDVHELVNSHLLMLNDRLFRQGPIDIVRQYQCNAEWAVVEQHRQIIEVFNQADDNYLRTRTDDIDYIMLRIINYLKNHQPSDTDHIGNDVRGRIIVTDIIGPAQIILFTHAGAIGFITARGSPASHASILAHNLNIPLLSGVAHAANLIKAGEDLIVDVDLGHVTVDPEQSILAFYQRKLQQRKTDDRRLQELIGRPCRTRDGHEIELLLNIDQIGDLKAIRSSLQEQGVAGVGLFRTEYQFLNRQSAPDEEELYQDYCKLLKAAGDKPVTLRTLDIGHDKLPTYLDRLDTPGGNPALGLRAIRYSLHHKRLFETQLRAMIRASTQGNARLLIPMITNEQEIHQVRNLIQHNSAQLQQQGIACNSALPVGVMIETPAAAVMAHHWCRWADFISIGTNDLIQYTLAVDRMDDQVSHLYQADHPAVLQLVFHIIQSARRHRLPVTLCGEMAADQRFTALLLAMGLESFSVPGGEILQVKQAILSSDRDHLTAEIGRIFTRGEYQHLEKYLH